MLQSLLFKINLCYIIIILYIWNIVIVSRSVKSDNWENNLLYYKASIISIFPKLNRIFKLDMTTYSAPKLSKTGRTAKVFIGILANDTRVFNPHKKVHIYTCIIVEASLIAPSAKCIPWGINLSIVDVRVVILGPWSYPPSSALFSFPRD